MNLDEAIIHAKKVNKPILVIITTDGEDYISTEFINDIICTQEFDEEIARNFVIYHADFSEKSYKKTVAPEGAPDDELLKAELYSRSMQSAFQLATILNLEYTPALYIFTKDGYVVSEVSYEDEILDIESLKSLLELYTTKIQKFNGLVKETTKGSKTDKVKAIHNLYTETEPEYRPLLQNLASTIPDLDPENKTGLANEYIFLSLEATAVSRFTEGDIAGAIQVYIDGANNPYLTLEEKQNCYYTAAFLIAQTGSEDLGLIIDYLRLAVAIAPNSESVDDIKQVLEYYSDLLLAQTYEQQQQGPDIQLEE